MQQFLSCLRILSPVAALALALTTGGARLAAQQQGAGSGTDARPALEADGTLQFHKVEQPATDRLSQSGSAFTPGNAAPEGPSAPSAENSRFWRSYLTESWRIAAQHAISGMAAGSPQGAGGQSLTENAPATPAAGSGGRPAQSFGTPSGAPGHGPGAGNGAWSLASQLSRSLAGQQGGGAAGFALRTLANVDQLLHGGVSLPVDFGSAASGIKLNYQNDLGTNQHGASAGQFNASYHTGRRVDFAAAAGLGFANSNAGPGAAGSSVFGTAAGSAGGSGSGPHAGMAMGVAGANSGQSGGGMAAGAAPGQGSNSFGRPGQGSKFSPSVSLHLNF